MRLRRLGSWKGLFYGAVIPALRRLDPARADVVLGALGRLFCDRRRRLLEQSILQAREALGTSWDAAAVRSALAANTPRLLARDLLLDHLDDADAFARFELEGLENLEAARAGGRGVVLLGSHFGAYIAALHWLDRRGLPLRLLVQRPTHASRRLLARFDADDPRFPQRAFTLRRGMRPGEASRCVLLARDALRAGFAVYLKGDVPHEAAGSQPGQLLGRHLPFAAVWADLARVTGAPVVPVFCVPRPAGRFRLTFEPPWSLTATDPARAVAAYLRRLEAWIAREPGAALAHLSWPALRPERTVPAKMAATDRRAGHAAKMTSLG